MHNVEAIPMYQLWGLCESGKVKVSSEESAERVTIYFKAKSGGDLIAVYKFLDAHNGKSDVRTDYDYIGRIASVSFPCLDESGNVLDDSDNLLVMVCSYICACFEGRAE